MNNTQPTRVGVQFTTDCNFQCSHCLVNCGPWGGRTMDVETVKSCAEAAMKSGADSFVFTGGEPLLHRELLLDGLAYAHHAGLRVQVITNAGWANHPHHRNRILDELVAGGLSSLAISCDVFHQPFVKNETIRQLVHEARERGIEPVLITVLCSDAANVEILRFIAELKVPVLVGSLSNIGRARELDANYYLPSPDQVGVCQQARAPMVLVDGTVTFCCGFADLAAEGSEVPSAAILGNVHNRGLLYLLREAALPIRSAFANYRIDTLLAVSGASEQGVRIEDFHCPCDICRFLLSNQHFAERLEALGTGQGLPAETDNRPSDGVDAHRPRRFVGRRVRMPSGGELIRDVRLYGWLGHFGGADGVFDILCLPVAPGTVDYHLTGKELRQVLVPLMSGETCLVDDPDDVRGGNVTERIEESVRRWMVIRLTQLGILKTVTKGESGDVS